MCSLELAVFFTFIIESSSSHGSLEGVTKEEEASEPPPDFNKDSDLNDPNASTSGNQVVWRGVHLLLDDISDDEDVPSSNLKSESGSREVDAGNDNIRQLPNVRNSPTSHYERTARLYQKPENRMNQASQDLKYQTSSLLRSLTHNLDRSATHKSASASSFDPRFLESTTPSSRQKSMPKSFSVDRNSSSPSPPSPGHSRTSRTRTMGAKVVERKNDLYHGLRRGRSPESPLTKKCKFSMPRHILYYYHNIDWISQLTDVYSHTNPTHHFAHQQAMESGCSHFRKFSRIWLGHVKLAILIPFPSQRINFCLWPNPSGDWCNAPHR